MVAQQTRIFLDSIHPTPSPPVTSSALGNRNPWWTHRTTAVSCLPEDPSPWRSRGVSRLNDDLHCASSRLALLATLRPNIGNGVHDTENLVRRRVIDGTAVRSRNNGAIGAARRRLAIWAFCLYSLADSNCRRLQSILCSPRACNSRRLCARLYGIEHCTRLYISTCCSLADGLARHVARFKGPQASRCQPASTL